MSHKKFFRFVVTCLLVTGTISFSSLVSAQNAEQVSIPKVGDTAPNFSLQDFEENEFELSEATQKRTVLLWFTNLCEGCQSKISDVEKLKSMYESKGVSVVAISVLGKDRETVETLIKKYNTTFQFLYDPHGSTTEIYSGKYIPGTCPMKNIFIISRSSKIAFASHLPGIEVNELIEQLNNVIKGEQQ